MKNDIQNRSDIALLVRSFYTDVRSHEILGPIFNSIITDWEAHFDLYLFIFIMPHVD